MSIKFELFTCKEHYLAFRKAFANAVNDKRAKSQLKPGYDNTKYRVKGWMTGAHFILLNLLRDKPINCGFTLKTNKTALINAYEPHFGFKEAVADLKEVCRTFKEDSWRQRRQKRFLEPLEGTVTVEMLNGLLQHIPEIRDLYMWRSEDAEIIAKLINNEITPEEIWKEVIHENN